MINLIEEENMFITINSNKTIEEVQAEFNSEFPYLKIQFFRHGHKAFKGNNKKELLPASTKIGALKHHDGSIEIANVMTVNELESLFKDVYGLNIQVFRRFGKSWLETTVTDSWTLQKQNDEGKELSFLD